jgi:hypothetical protein
MSLRVIVARGHAAVATKVAMVSGLLPALMNKCPTSHFSRDQNSVLTCATSVDVEKREDVPGWAASIPADHQRLTGSFPSRGMAPTDVAASAVGESPGDVVFIDG